MPGRNLDLALPQNLGILDRFPASTDPAARLYARVLIPIRMGTYGPCLAHGVPMNKLAASALAALTGISLNAASAVGIQAVHPLGEGSVIVPRADFVYGHATTTLGGDPNGQIDESTTLNMLALGVDFNYFIQGRAGRGFYFLGGVGVAYADIEISVSSPVSSASNSSNQLKIYPEVGVGYLFPIRVGVEMLYKPINFNRVFVNIDGGKVSMDTGTHLVISAYYRF